MFEISKINFTSNSIIFFYVYSSNHINKLYGIKYNIFIFWLIITKELPILIIIIYVIPITPIKNLASKWSIKILPHYGKMTFLN